MIAPLCWVVSGPPRAAKFRMSPFSFRTQRRQGCDSDSQLRQRERDMHTPPQWQSGVWKESYSHLTGAFEMGDPFFVADRHTNTVTRKKVAGMAVASWLGPLFWLLNSAVSSSSRSSARPFLSAASNAFMVGP